MVTDKVAGKDKALEQANKAFLANEVPIGAVLVDNNTNEIITSSHNLINSLNNSIFVILADGILIKGTL